MLTEPMLSSPDKADGFIPLDDDTLGMALVSMESERTVTNSSEAPARFPMAQMGVSDPALSSASAPVASYQQVFLNVDLSLFDSKQIASYEEVNTTQHAPLLVEAPAEPQASRTCLYRFKKFFGGTAPAFSSWVARQPAPLRILLTILETLLRSMGQLTFANNPFSGVIISLGLLFAKPGILLPAYLSIIGSCTLAASLGFPKGLIVNGVYGINAALLGLGIYTFTSFGVDYGTWLIMYTLPLLLMGGLTTLLQEALNKALIPHLGVSPFAIPFSLVAIGWLVATQTSTGFPDYTPFPPYPAMAITFLSFWSGVSASIGAVVFCGESWIAALSLVFAAFVYSPVTAMMILGGAVAAGVACLLLQVPDSFFISGLFGYCPVLCATSLGGVFFVPTWRSLLYALLCSAVCVPVQAALSILLFPYPVFALPFALSAICFLLAANASPFLQPVSLATITTPEYHAKRAKAQAAVSN